MKTYKKKKITVHEPKTIKCDICGKVYEYDSPFGSMEIDEFLQIDHTCGFGSVFVDSKKISCDICQRCLKEKLGEFLKIQKGWQ